MSDGPYRSLPMRKAWRDVSEYAHKDAYSLDERADKMFAALHDDFERDVGRERMDAVGAILLDHDQGSLLASQAHTELNEIRKHFTATGLFEAVIEHTQVALHQGMSGEDALKDGVNRAVVDHAAGQNRAVEEWYYRDSSSAKGKEKAGSVRANLDATLSTNRIHSFGTSMVALMRGEKVHTKPKKDSGIDAGPEIY